MESRVFVIIYLVHNYNNRRNFTTITLKTFKNLLFFIQFLLIVKARAHMTIVLANEVY